MDILQKCFLRFPLILRQFYFSVQKLSFQEDQSVLSAQYRVIERRLLAKIKDTTASNLSSIERLLQDTFTRIMAAIVRHQNAHQAVTATAQEIRQLVTLWRRCWKRDPEDVSGLMMTCLENVGQQVRSHTSTVDKCLSVNCCQTKQ